MRSARIWRYSRSTGCPLTTPRPPQSCAATSMTCGALSVDASFANRDVVRQCGAAPVALRGRTVGEQCRGVDEHGQLRELGLRDLRVGQYAAEQAPTDVRNTSRIRIAILKPSPGAPWRCASGTRQPVKRSSASGCGAITSMRRDTAKPRGIRVDDEGRDLARRLAARLVLFRAGEDDV